MLGVTQRGRGPGRLHLRLPAWLALLLLLPAAGLDAQPRTEIGAWVAGSVPQGAFERNVDTGFGFGGHLLLPLSRGGWLRARVEAGNVIYGRETLEVPLSRTVGRVRVDVTTTNNVAMLGVGPELTVPTGRVRPYLNGLVGGSLLFTESSVEGDRNVTAFANDTNFSDLTWAVAPGAGVAVLLGSGPGSIRLDLGAQYRFQGTARYLQEGGIEDLPDGDVELNPVESDTDLLLVRAGLTFTL